jgi:cytochrome c-type biogenesis protein CcsB
MGRLEILFSLALYGYLLATILCWLWFFWRKRALWIAGTSVVAASVALQVAFITALGIVAGRPPFKDTFETLVLFAAAFALFYLVSLLFYESKPLAPLAAVASLFVTLFAYLIMPDEIENLVPALRDDLWLTVHVAFCFASYAAFLLSYVAALCFLAREDGHAAGAALAVALTASGLAAGLVLVMASRSEAWEANRRAFLGGAVGGAVLLAVALWPAVGWLGRRLRVRERLPEKALLQKMVYKTVTFGFPFLTLGIATGSYWASQAWGRYWGWDPKEVASLVTWLVFAVYLHLRLVPKWRGPWVAWIAVGGFWCVLFTYFGVNYLPVVFPFLKGLHSY